MRALETEYKNRLIVLECTHKKTFPPPQMYGMTVNDIDILWSKGQLSQAEYEHLKTWREHCGLMIMGPKCLDCHLAKRRNPRIGNDRYTLSNWLEDKDRIYWEDMKNSRLQPNKVVEDIPEEQDPLMDVDDGSFEDENVG